MHKTDCIWTEPERCNCGWLQEIAKNPRRVDDEIERLRAELADLQDGYSRLSRDFALAIESDSKHIAELAECREDAERWRYLRDDGCGFEITVREENEDGYESWVSGYPGAELDAAIDAARKGEGE